MSTSSSSSSSSSSEDDELFRRRLRLRLRELLSSPFPLRGLSPLFPLAFSFSFAFDLLAFCSFASESDEDLPASLFSLFRELRSFSLLREHSFPVSLSLLFALFFSFSFSLSLSLSFSFSFSLSLFRSRSRSRSFASSRSLSLSRSRSFSRSRSRFRSRSRSSSRCRSRSRSLSPLRSVHFLPVAFSQRSFSRSHAFLLPRSSVIFARIWAYPMCVLPRK
mmetsp:Transcript_90300/g.254861  ORF Transcript_90300/g.254861 Transcript_90300/m.254861 type:complete len:220 (-) Transcript_90300:693-1352(-)